MGECPYFVVRFERTGAFRYHGKANVERLGDYRGSVSSLRFDMIASVVETSGFLSLPAHGEVSSTVGDTEIEIETSEGSRSFSRDGLDTCPIFWAVETLLGVLFDGAEWGDDAYQKAFQDPNDLPEPLHVIEAALNHDRRVLPNSAVKRYLRAHRIQPPEFTDDETWVERKQVNLL